MSDSTELEALRGIYAVWKDVAPEVSADLSRKVRAAFATKDAEIASLKADLAALREAVRALPEYHCTDVCAAVQVLYQSNQCTCRADQNNAALAAARKLAGLGE